MRPSSRATLSVGALLPLLAACATVGAGGGVALGGREWRLVELAGQPVPAGDADLPHLRFALDGGRVTGSTGCNSLAGPFTADGASLRFGELITTRRACTEPARDRRERDFLAALDRTRTHVVHGDTLTLLDEGVPLARLAAAGPP